ncbi:hypothetical protein ElyMa_005690100 [Elysia marginata]|uniref:Uncharacterized protein n=1 Tax=Elysia marginata TaxID=1093978 RepID=A0AAV4FEX2_9GAST|nr:hypothetical protein ElyMa_005690100 [Elysia marginata]
MTTANTIINIYQLPPLPQPPTTITIAITTTTTTTTAATTTTTTTTTTTSQRGVMTSKSSDVVVDVVSNELNLSFERLGQISLVTQGTEINASTRFELRDLLVRGTEAKLTHANSVHKTPGSKRTMDAHSNAKLHPEEL